MQICRYVTFTCVQSSPLKGCFVIGSLGFDFGCYVVIGYMLPRVSSPDIRINGKPADLKKTNSVKNIIKHASKAVNQGAELVIFEFTEFNEEYLGKIEHLKGMGIKGLYYISSENKIYKF